MPTSTFNPTDDGWAGNQSGDQTWATIRAAAGGLKRSQGDGTNEAIAMRNGTTSPLWDLMRRGLFTIDTSSLGAGVTITAAKLRLFINSKTETIAGQSLVLVNGGPASNTVIAASDYEGNVSNTTIIGDTVALSAITTGAYNEWNFTDLSVISKTGYTKFGLRYESERANSEPSWTSAGAVNSMNWNFGNAVSNKSELVVTYSTVAGAALMQALAF